MRKKMRKKTAFPVAMSWLTEGNATRGGYGGIPYPKMVDGRWAVHDSDAGWLTWPTDDIAFIDERDIVGYEDRSLSIVFLDQEFCLGQDINRHV